MHPCRFYLGPPKLDNNVIDARNHVFNYYFETDNIKYKSQPDVDKSKYRVVLRHKKTGEVLKFNEKWLLLKPENQSLSSSTNIKGISNSPEIESKHTNTIEDLILSPRKEILTPRKRKLKTESVSDLPNQLLIKCNKIKEQNVKDMLNSENKLELSSIAPIEVLNTLIKMAQGLSTRNAKELSELVTKKHLFPSVLLVLKQQPTNDFKKIELCILLNYMLKLQSMNVKVLRRQDPIEECPPLVMQFLINAYTDKKKTDNDSKKQQIQITKEHRNKLLTFIVALFAYLTDYHFSLRLLQIDLAASIDRIKKNSEVFDVKISRPVKTVGEDETCSDFYLSTKTPFVSDS